MKIQNKIQHNKKKKNQNQMIKQQKYKLKIHQDLVNNKMILKKLKKKMKKKSQKKVKNVIMNQQMLNN